MPSGTLCVLRYRHAEPTTRSVEDGIPAERGNEGRRSGGGVLRAVSKNWRERVINPSLGPSPTTSLGGIGRGEPDRADAGRADRLEGMVDRGERLVVGDLEEDPGR